MMQNSGSNRKEKLVYGITDEMGIVYRSRYILQQELNILYFQYDNEVYVIPEIKCSIWWVLIDNKVIEDFLALLKLSFKSNKSLISVS